MQIRCPVCEYARQVDEGKIPATAEFATCPKCRHRFRFRALDLDEVEKPAPPAPNPDHADVWDAVDSLQDRWQEKDEEEDSGDGEDWEDGDEDGGERPETRAGIPWENPRVLGYPASFIRTAMWAFFQPSSFFASFSPRPALLPAFAFYLVFGVMQSVFGILWIRLLASSMPDHILQVLGQDVGEKFLAAVAEMTVFSTALLALPFQLAVLLCLSAAAIYAAVAVMLPRGASFPLAFKVAAYASAAQVLIVIPVAGAFLSYAGYMALLFIGCRSAFRLSWGRAFLAAGPLCFLLFFLASSSASLFTG